MGDAAPSIESWGTGVSAFVFIVLTAAAGMRARRAGRPGWWLTGMFGALSLHLSFAWLRSAVDLEVGLWTARLVQVVLLAFPYLLLRFAASFRRVPRWAEVLAGVIAVLVAIGSLALPEDSDDLSWLPLYLVLILIYWLGLSLLASTRLWQAGRGQPTVARRRMRLMSVATGVLAFALLMSAVTDGGPAEAAVLLLVALSGLLFGVGFMPPRALVLAWRQPEDQALRQAMMAVLRSTTREEIAAELLLPVARIVGGEGAALVDDEGRVVATYGKAPAVGSTVSTADVADGASTTGPSVVPLQEGQGRLVVWTGRYTPFFASEEIEVLGTMGAFAGMALERSELLREERVVGAALRETQLEAEKARDEAHRANTAKSDFLSRMSHELRTPLNAILGFGQLLQMAPLDTEDQEGVTHILKAGQHLLALINDVLDLSRIEAGAMTISIEPVHAGQLIDDAVSLIRPLADARSIRLEKAPGDDDQFIRTDRQRCRQILLNLLSNAVKYNRDGGNVTVTCIRGADHLRIAVRDSGPGIDLHRQEHLFEPFERLGAESTGVEGTGLGLALTRQLVQAMGGAVGVHSTPGVGSTFWVDLPLTEPPAGPSDAADEDEVVADGSPGAARTLLLVEDNLANLRLVEALLRRRSDVSILPAMSGQIAIDLADQHEPDVIVLDLHLPDLGGREVLQRLKANPRTRDIPVLVASADAMPGRRRQLEAEGAFGYLTKPLELHAFLQLLDAALAQSARPRADQRP